MRYVLSIIVAAIMFNGVKHETAHAGFNYVQSGELYMVPGGYMQVPHDGESFSGDVPFGKYFNYTSRSNIEWPKDRAYHVTVIYSTKDIRTDKDKYLYAWFRKHPSLVSLRRQTNFYEAHIEDPAYRSYLQRSLPVTPAILITKPPVPGGGYFGEVVYCAYGRYLSTNPNTIALEISTALRITADRKEFVRKYGLQPGSQAFTNAQWRPRPYPPGYPDYPPQYPLYPPQRQPPYRPQHQPQYTPQSYPQALPPMIPSVKKINTERGMLGMETSTILLLLGIAAILFIVVSKRR